jgi:hypothetical protein
MNEEYEDYQYDNDCGSKSVVSKIISKPSIIIEEEDNYDTDGTNG